MAADALEGRRLLSLLQISDSAFPTGAFSHSQGLEAFHAAGELEDAEDLSRLVRLQLGALATSDCVALRVAHGTGGVKRAADIDRLLTATKLARELREASASTGRKFLRSASAFGIGGRVEEFGRLVREGGADGNLAVCHGVACSELGIGEQEALHAYLYASAASLVAAGQKLIPLGGNTAQHVLYEVGEEALRAAEDSAGMEAEDMYGFAPTVDLRSMLHERQRVRLYIS
ncbi:MAG: urease accessory protein UreF [Actinomycetota bacterium]|nr:urease accessory protein UreF [Actinomycetota bacterium]